MNAVMLMCQYCHCRDKYESLMDKEMRKNQLNVGHNHSHDSAIDTDIQEWETETIDVDVVSLDF
jgi:hypothetical protein